MDRSKMTKEELKFWGPAKQHTIDFAYEQCRKNRMRKLKEKQEEEQLKVEEDVAISEATLQSNRVRLYKALGGGWDADATPYLNNSN